MTVGYVGLGAMGEALAGHLIETNDLVVWDINPAARARFVDRGAQAARSLAELGSRCNVVMLCLPKSDNVEQALFGDGGLAETMPPDSIVVDQTSGDSFRTREFSDRLAKQGIRLIDAPVAGGVPSAVAGKITIMASGPEDVFTRALPVLRVMSDSIHFCGATVGEAQQVKAINNLVNSANRIATLEIVAAGRRLGVDFADLSDAINNGPARSFVTSRLLPAIAERRSSADFALALMAKDLKQAADLAIAYDAPMPVSETGRGMINAALSIIGADARLDDVVVFMQDLMQTDLLAPRDAGVIEPRFERADALRLVESTLVACNRLVIIENSVLARRAGLDMPSFAEIMLSGSAASAEAEAVFRLIAGEATSDVRSIGQLIDDLSRLAEVGSRCLLPMLMTNQARAQCVRVANELGREASIDRLLE